MSRHGVDGDAASDPDDDLASADEQSGDPIGGESNERTDHQSDERPVGRASGDDRETASSDDALELAARAELLTEENRRLREEYTRARQSRYRRTALGLVALGLVSAVGGVLFPDGQQVLFAFAGTGLFGGLLTYYLAPGQFVAAEIGERVYAASASNGAALAGELGLRAVRVYVPTDDSALVRLFVPRRAEHEIPDDLSGPIVTDDDSRGLLLEPTGVGLYREFERGLSTELAVTPPTLATQLADALVEQFELARSADPDVDVDPNAFADDAADVAGTTDTADSVDATDSIDDDGSADDDGLTDDDGSVDDTDHTDAGDEETGGVAIVAISDSAFGPVDRFDHPIASFLAVGFAVGLERPIELEVLPGDDRADWLVVCRWKRD